MELATVSLWNPSTDSSVKSLRACHVGFFFNLLLLHGIVRVTAEGWLFAFFQRLHDSASLKHAILSLGLPVFVEWSKKRQNLDKIIQSLEIKSLLLRNSFNLAFFLVGLGKNSEHKVVNDGLEFGLISCRQ
jgi:hypothetical protein